jgi:hypothetical protein
MPPVEIEVAADVSADAAPDEAGECTKVDAR